MKLKNAKIENVRNIRCCELEFSSGCTVISGRNGSGKTTMQEAIQSALFGLQHRRKEQHVSKFDPDSMPMVEFNLTFDGEKPVELSRSLLNKDGKWQQNGKTIRAKGKALDLFQQHLGIPVVAADSLLCSNHMNFANLLEEFPDDMQSLLTAKCVRGSGPEPKSVLARLEKDRKAAKSKGQKNPGIISVLTAKLQSLNTELGNAEAATDRAKQLQKSYREQLAIRDQLDAKLRTDRAKLQKLQESQKLMVKLIQSGAKIKKAKEQQTSWSSLCEKTTRANKVFNSVKVDLSELETQFRVQKKREIESELFRLKYQIQVCKELEDRIAAASSLRDEKLRPGKPEVQLFSELAAHAKNLESKINATGVHFRLESKIAQSIEIAIDGGQSEPVKVDADSPLDGVVGSVRITAGDLAFTAFGKENVAALKIEVDAIQEKQATLLRKFGCVEFLNFQESAELREKLEQDVTSLQANLKIKLAGFSITGLENSATRLEQELASLQVSLSDEKAVSGRVLGSLSSIEKRIAAKQVEVENAKQKLRECEIEKPSEAEINQLTGQLVEANSSLAVTQEAFSLTKCRREVSPAELKSLEADIEKQTLVVESKTCGASEANVTLAKIEKDLEHSGGFRRKDEIANDITAVNTSLEREGRRQEARLLLMERIEAKMNRLAEGVPVQLSDQVAKHLSQLTIGLFSSIELNDNLSIRNVYDSSGHGVNWNSSELSTGERTLVALAIRIAIALSVADTYGTAFLMLDDAFTSLDPCYLAATEDLIESVVKDGRIQIALFTCHENWAAKWESKAPRDFKFVCLKDNCSYFMDRRVVAHRVAQTELNSVKKRVKIS